MRVGAIDVGSNSIRLLVADVTGTPDGVELITVSRAGEPCRLGRGLESSGVIEPAMVEQAERVVREFAQRARQLGARHLVLGATAALRSAANGDSVAEQLGAAAGVPARILSGEAEARLIYRTVVESRGSDARRQACVVFDLGGGSTEIVSGVGVTAGRWVSLPLGAVSLTERFGLADPSGPPDFGPARNEINRQIMHGCAQFPSVAPYLCGVGGTVTVLAALDRGIQEYDPNLLEGWTIDRARCLGHAADLLARTPEERRGLPIMGEGRADIAGAGALVVEALLQRFQPPALVCSTRGLRYGLAKLAAEELLGGDPGTSR